jgi:hypothetical protein
LRAHHEQRAADWFEEYWTGERGNYTLAHAGVGGTNNNCGTEGRWNGVKKEVCGSAGTTTSLSVRTVVPSILRFLTNKSKESASYWKRGTRSRCKTSSAMFTFPSIPMPIKMEWDHLESLDPNILELATVYASADVKTAWDLHIGDILGADKDEGVTGATAHVQIRALFDAKPTAKAPPRRNISYFIIPSKSLIDRIDPERKMTAAECRAALDADLVKFDSMLKCPAVFEELVPDWDAEDYIALHESFYLLEPLEERWGKWVSWKP